MASPAVGIVVRRNGEVGFLPADVARRVVARPVLSRVPGTAVDMTLLEGRVVPVVYVGSAGRDLVLCDFDGDVVAVSGLEIVDAGPFEETAGGVVLHGKSVPQLDVAAEIRHVVAHGAGGNR